jgi:hypothetical protein
MWPRAVLGEYGPCLQEQAWRHGPYSPNTARVHINVQRKVSFSIDQNPNLTCLNES